MRRWIFFLLCINLLAADSVSDLKKSVLGTMEGMYGWCTKEKAIHFIDLVLQVKPDLCVEVGVFGGRSLFPVASALKYLDKGVIVGIDPWDKEEIIRYFDPVRDKVHIEWWSKVNMDQIYYTYLNTLSQHQLDDYVITLRTKSEQAAAALSDIDILYLDGNHYEAVSVQDVKLYLPKVKSGGYIWLNDSLWVDLQAAVDLLFEQCEFVKIIDGGNCILFRKK